MASEDLVPWLLKHSDWYGSRQAEMCDIVLPYARSHGAEVFGCVGTCWGGYMVTRLSGEILFTSLMLKLRVKNV